VILQDFALGGVLGFGIGIFVRNPFWALNALIGRGEDGEGVPAIWGLFTFALYVGLWYAAFLDGDVSSTVAVLTSSALWLYRSRT
jgi:hypothetical protein